MKLCLFIQAWFRHSIELCSHEASDIWALRQLNRYVINLIHIETGTHIEPLSQTCKQRILRDVVAAVLIHVDFG